MICENVSRNDIRALKVGETGFFTLPNFKALESARVQFCMMKKLEDMDFERVKTSEPMTIAYKRLR